MIGVEDAKPTKEGFGQNEPPAAGVGRRVIDLLPLGCAGFASTGGVRPGLAGGPLGGRWDFGNVSSSSTTAEGRRNIPKHRMGRIHSLCSTGAAGTDGRVGPLLAQVLLSCH